MIAPILSVGTFGTHLIGNDRGFSFTGTVPTGIKVGCYATEADGIAAFVLGSSHRMQHSRNDVFVAVLAA
jgi:hypothetical protein